LTIVIMEYPSSPSPFSHKGRRGAGSSIQKSTEIDRVLPGGFHNKINYH
jgi:hypothetical protein